MLSSRHDRSMVLASGPLPREQQIHCYNNIFSDVDFTHGFKLTNRPQKMSVLLRGSLSSERWTKLWCVGSWSGKASHHPPVGGRDGLLQSVRCPWMI